MPFIANTPESLLGRSDSLNPKTTCHGITSSGLPCRRPLTESTVSAPKPRRGKRAPTDLTDPTLYCWQHKDQAAGRSQPGPGPRISASHSGGGRRSSIDTLTERLGLTALSDTQYNPSSSQNNEGGRRKKKQSSFTFCCCFTIPMPIREDEELYLPPRPRPRPTTQSPAAPGGRVSGQSKKTTKSGDEALVPASASPETAALLLAEMAKPISAQDDPGYIYMFWLTPESEAVTAPKEATRSLLSPPSTPLASRQRRPSDVLAAFANTAFDMWGDSDSDSDQNRPSSSRNVRRDVHLDRERRVQGKKAGKKTMLLKIGRATNVQRRLNEWKRQCGYDLSLIRYYPYIPSGSPDATPRKMPHSHKVERLIHIELAGAGLRVLDGDKCDACGREHREWFEVEATRSAIRKVDDTVKRWADWDEGLI